MTTKLHLAITAEGHIVEGMLTGGQIHDFTVADDLLDDVVSCYVVEDMGYAPMPTGQRCERTTMCR